MSGLRISLHRGICSGEQSLCPSGAQIATRFLPRPSADSPSSPDSGVSLDGNTLLVILEMLCSKGHALINHDVVADDAGRTDDDTSSVVNSEMVADGGCGVDVYALRIAPFIPSCPSSPVISSRGVRPISSVREL